MDIYNLDWNNYEDHVVGAFKNLKTERHFVDVAWYLLQAYRNWTLKIPSCTEIETVPVQYSKNAKKTSCS